MEYLSGEQKAYLKNLSPRARTCKAYMRHPFDVIVPGEAWPKTIRAVIVTGGIDLIYTCPNCGREKVEELGPEAVIGLGEAKPKYRGGEGGKETYLAPKGLGLTKHDYRRYHANEVARMIKKAAK